MKIKTAALILLIASIMWLIDLLYYAYGRIWGESAKYYSEHPLDNVISYLFILIPVSFIIFSWALYARKPKNMPQQISGDPEAAGILDIEVPDMTVGAWLGTFFIVIIPVIGLIFLIVWSIDNNKPVRKNWAIASLIWSVFLVILAVIVIVVARYNVEY